MSARISECGTYRYFLNRPPLLSLKNPQPPILWIMLNPSTADATIDDPTIRKCRGFAQQWNCNGINVVNLYALRSTDPAKLKTHFDPIGPKNFDFLMHAALNHRAGVCAWGSNANSNLVDDTLELLKRTGIALFCLGKNKDGSPRHPLYLPYSTPLIDYP